MTTIQDHELNQEMEAVLRLTSQALAEESQPDVRRVLRRIQEALDFLKTRLGTSKASLVPWIALDRARDRAKEARNALEAYIADRNAGYVSTAEARTDDILIELSSLPPMPFKVHAAALKTAADDFTNHLVSKESDVLAEFEALGQELDSKSQQFQQSILTLKSDIDAKVEGLEKQFADMKTAADNEIQLFSSGANARLTELTTEVTTQKTRLERALSDNQSQFSTAQEKRIEDFNEKLKTLETAFVEASNTMLSDVRQAHDTMTAKASELVDDLEDKAKRAAQVLGLSAAAEVAQAYKDDALEQKQQADTWRRIAMGFFLCLAAGAALIRAAFPPEHDYTVADYARYTLTWIPVFLALAPGVPYAIKQSSEHRRREREARRRWQELASFRPFLAELDDVQQQKLIGDAAPKYFSGDGFDSSLLDEKAASSGLLEALAKTAENYLKRK